jgi:hypothetical protein
MILIYTAEATSYYTSSYDLESGMDCTSSHGLESGMNRGCKSS